MNLWDHLSVEAAINSVVLEVQRSRAGVHGKTWLRGNDVYPLRATTSFYVRGAPWDEDVVLSAAIKSGGTELAFDCDICDGDGQYLSVGPESSASLSALQDDLRAWADDCLRQYVEFLHQHLAVIIATLDAREKGS